MRPKGTVKPETLLTSLATDPKRHRGAVNIPVYRASTILFDTLAEFENADRGKCEYGAYGRYGTVATEQLENMIAELEGADHSIALSCGASAVALVLTSLLSAGDHLLMVDNVYGPTRRLCDHELARFGIETTYYDPTIGAGIKDLIKDNTKMIFIESPGSLTFEVQDVPAIVKEAKAKDVIVVGDNTWGTPLYYRPFELGMDVSIQSATKYISGHSDMLMGTVSCNEKYYKDLVRTFRVTGACPSGDTCFLAMRGLRTMAVRLKQHYESAMTVANWFKSRPEVEEVLYPALPGAPGHDIWKRDFSGACGLFAIALKDQVPHDALAQMVDHLELFGMGYSWGGYESLITPVNLGKMRTATTLPYKGQVLRIHIGLEHTDDLIADLSAGFDRMNKAL